MDDHTQPEIALDLEADLLLDMEPEGPPVPEPQPMLPSTEVRQPESEPPHKKPGFFARIGSWFRRKKKVPMPPPLPDLVVAEKIPSKEETVYKLQQGIHSLGRTLQRIGNQLETQNERSHLLVERLEGLPSVLERGIPASEEELALLRTIVGELRTQQASTDEMLRNIQTLPAILDSVQTGTDQDVRHLAVLERVAAGLEQNQLAKAEAAHEIGMAMRVIRQEAQEQTRVARALLAATDQQTERLVGLGRELTEDQQHRHQEVIEAFSRLDGRHRRRMEQVALVGSIAAMVLFCVVTAIGVGGFLWVDRLVDKAHADTLEAPVDAPALELAQPDPLEPVYVQEIGAIDVAEGEAIEDAEIVGATVPAARRGPIWDVKFMGVRIGIAAGACPQPFDGAGSGAPEPVTGEDLQYLPREGLIPGFPGD